MQGQYYRLKRIPNNNNQQNFLLIVSAVIFFFWFVYPELMKNNQSEQSEDENLSAQLRERFEQPKNIIREINDKGMVKSSSNRAEYDALKTKNTENGYTGDRRYLEDRDVDVREDQYYLDDGEDKTQILHHNLCSKSCCSPQYPTPFHLKHDPLVCKNKGEYVPSNIFCNNIYQDSGCLCLTKNQAHHLASRGGNAYSNMQ